MIPFCKIYITDEGFGPIVRQSAIVEELKQFDQTIRFTVQTQEHFKEAKRVIKGVDFKNKYNLITWHKLADGSPDIVKIRKAFENYHVISERFIESEKNNNVHFIISDFVYEAFELAHRKKIPSFGIAHFTWDWFFSKLYPLPLETSVLQRFFDFASKANVIYFPPFTPAEILKHYKKNAKQVPLIVRKNISQKKIPANKKFKVLLIDSGSGVLGKEIQKGIKNFHKLNDFHFYVSSSFKSASENISFINKDEFFIDYIEQMDLVIGRAGFNTISECIAFRTPMLLLGEAMNPEMNENIIHIKKEGLGSFISMEEFSGNLQDFLPKFVNREFKTIKENMLNHNYQTNGAKVIAEDILNRIS